MSYWKTTQREAPMEEECLGCLIAPDEWKETERNLHWQCCTCPTPFLVLDKNFHIAAQYLSRVSFFITQTTFSFFYSSFVQMTVLEVRFQILIATKCISHQAFQFCQNCFRFDKLTALIGETQLLMKLIISTLKNIWVRQLPDCNNPRVSYQSS